MKFTKKRPDRLTRLAEAIEKLGDRDQRQIDEASRVERLRWRGAERLHDLCRRFVDDLNSKLTEPTLLLSPPDFTQSDFDDSGINLFQINLRGRLLQIEFEPTEQLMARDDFRYPYFLRGAVRSFNQDSLERSSVDEQLAFCCVRDQEPVWFYFDPRTYRSGWLDTDYLTARLERLL